MHVAGRSSDEALKELNSNYQQYKLIEQELRQRRARLLGKIPEIQKAVDAVDMLIRKQEAGQQVHNGLPWTVVLHRDGALCMPRVITFPQPTPTRRPMSCPMLCIVALATPY